MALKSYFKSVLFLIGNSMFSQPLAVEAVYWLLSVGLVFAFILALWQTSSASVPRPEASYSETYEIGDRAPLLGLRALACLNVFMGHWFMVVFGPNVPAQTPGEYALRASLSFSPWCGVWMFFSLSGYLMGKGFVTGRHSTDRNGLLKFYFNRVRRIVPVYLIAIFLVMALVKPELFDLRTEGPRNSLLSSILLDNAGGGAIGALWSVSTEFQFYLLAPFMFLLLWPLRDRPRFLIALGCVVLAAFCFTKFAILNSHHELWISYIYTPLIPNLDCFLVGMLTAYFVKYLRQRNLVINAGVQKGILLTVATQILLSLWSFHEMAGYEGFPGSSTRLYYLAAAPAVTAALTCGIILIFELSARPFAGLNILWRASAFLGSITYCLYVVHEPVLLSLRKIFPAKLEIADSIMIFPLGFVVAILLASIFYYLIEKRFDRIPFPGVKYRAVPTILPLPPASSIAVIAADRKSHP